MKNKDMQEGKQKLSGETCDITKNKRSSQS